MDYESSRKVFNKKAPSDGGNTYIPLPSNAMHYINHPKMDAGKLYLYALIIDYYNVDDGYAYPAIDTLSVKYGCVEDTTSKHLDILKEVGLIDFPEKGAYVPLEPLPEEAFYEQFPEAWANYKRRLQRKESRRSDAKERMRKWRQNKGY